jgi:hypothetical protein
MIINEKKSKEMILVHVEAEKSIKNAVFYHKHRINPFRGQITMVSILLHRVLLLLQSN